MEKTERVELWEWVEASIGLDDSMVQRLGTLFSDYDALEADYTRAMQVFAGVESEVKTLKAKLAAETERCVAAVMRESDRIPGGTLLRIEAAMREGR